MSQWTKGHSGNPRGRPKRGAALSELLRYQLGQIVGEDGRTTRAEELARVLLGKALEGDVAAIKVVLERVEGPVRQDVALSGPGGGPIVQTIAITPATLAELTALMGAGREAKQRLLVAPDAVGASAEPTA